MELLEHEQVELLSAVVFTYFFVEHLARSVLDSAIVVGELELPIYVSYLTVLVTGFLTYDFWRKVLNEYEVV